MVLVRAGVVLALELLKQRVMLVVDLLHDFRAAAHVGVIFQGKTAVSCFQFVKGVDVGKIFHGCSPFVCVILALVCVFLRDI